MHNAEVYGFDCNPIAKLISECKLINLTKEQVITILDNFRELDLIEVNQSSEMYSLHNFEGRDHWFSQNAQREFGLLLKIINKFDRDSKEWILLATMQVWYHASSRISTNKRQPHQQFNSVLGMVFPKLVYLLLSPI